MVDTAESIDTILMGDDTDLLVLIFHAQHLSKKKLRSSWTKEKLGAILCKHILFIDAFLGCDTTSRINGFEKSALLKKIKS